ncbi:DNA metabolism protein [Lithospermum erythrorhizon]|uniref:DNA metabolism protein n=1 Tax=Lithospermum erythrorhizon TaxID=34254 RepID=A0AAV3PWP8_LITER
MQLKVALDRTKKSGKKQCEEDKELFEACMKRFLYTCCYSSFEFLATLKTLNYQLQKEKHKQEAGPLLLMIDSVGAFYWMDRGLPSLALGANRKSLTLQTTSEIVVQEMQRLLSVHPMVVLATKTVNLGQMHTTKVSRKQKNWSSNEVLPYREYMPSVWRTFVTHRILLQTSDDKEHQNNLIYLAEWLFPSLNLVDKFILSDGGVFIA